MVSVAQKNKGFTLIELLAVIAIIGLLTVLVVPSLIKTFSSSIEDIMKLQEAEVQEAANLYIQDYCFSPLDETYICPLTFTLNAKGERLYSGEISLTTLIEKKYIDKVELRGTTCTGGAIVKRNNVSASLVCEDKYVSKSAVDYGLIAHYPFDDFQEPSVNLIPNSPKNSYPQVGNTHGTYSTNQYNGGSFFSIGTIGSITNNIVTLSSVGREIFTYDALTPQTTGGGVTAGTKYFIKKISSNTFSLHAYDDTADGSKGFAVHNSILNDQRVSINATNFPTMWYGPSHTPNTDLVKEIVPNCFSSTSTSKHECIRLYTNFNPATSTAGMAYGVAPAVTAGKSYTISFYYRAVNEQSINNNIQVQIYTSPNWAHGPNKTLNSTEEWSRYEFTYTASLTGGATLYFFSGADVEISEISFEEKNYATKFTEGTRTGIIKDSSSNSLDASLALASSPRWINDCAVGEGCYDFNGSTSYIDLGNSREFMPKSLTISLWLKFNNTENNGWMAINKAPGGTSGSYYIYADSPTNATFSIFGSSGERYNAGFGTTLEKEKWYHMVGSYDFETKKMKTYINGVLKNTVDNAALGENSANVILGKYTPNDITYLFDGKLDDVRIYDRALTDIEIKELYKVKN